MEKKYKLREYQEGDEKGLAENFNLVNNKHRSLKQWNWKYKGNPDGFKYIIATNKEDKIIGQVSVLLHKGIYKGKNYIFYNFRDICIEKEYRGGNFFKQVLIKFLEGKKTLRYGLAEPILQRVLSTKKYSQSISNILQVDKLRKKIRLRDRIKFFINRIKSSKLKSSLKVNKRDLDELWEKKKNEIDVGVIRDGNYIKWRVINCPSNIKIIKIMKNKEIIGYFVLERKRKISYIMDILIINKYISKEIVSLIEKNIPHSSNEIRIMTNDDKLKEMFLKSKYCVFKREKCYFFDDIKNQKDINIYLTYVDGTDGNENIK